MSQNSKILNTILLEALCYAPVSIVMGNLLPPIGPIKIHWIYIGLIFLLSLSLAIINKRTAGLLLLLLFFIIVQAVTAIKFSLIDFVDFVAGPLVFISIVNIVIENKISIEKLYQFRMKTLIGFAFPMTIALFQYIKIIPLEFLNAKYVNVTIYGTEEIERVNGFLYHGIELAVIIFFFFASLIILIRSRIRNYIILTLMIFSEFMTTIKTGIISAILFSGFFSYFIDLRFRFLKSILILVIVVLGFSYIYTLIPDIQENRFEFDSVKFRFDDQLFTGRGYIWNTYIQGIRHFSFLQVLFGGGFGSAPIIFEENSPSRVEWSAGTHNQLLELFINGGLLAIFLIYVIIKKQYHKLVSLFVKYKSTFDKYFVGIVAIPLVTMGLTSPIMSMFIYWCGLSVAIVSIKLKFNGMNSAI